MKKAIILGMLIIIILSGCVQESEGNGSSNGENGGNGMDTEKVELGDKVSVDYKGTLEDGTEFDSSIGKRPLEFTAGAGQMIKGFDAAVIGMAAGEEKTVTLAPEDAYGEADPARIVEIPKDQVQDLGTIEVGMTLTSSQGINGVVKEIKDEAIVVDFNHPLAGKTLTFWIKVVSIEKS